MDNMTKRGKKSVSSERCRSRDNTFLYMYICFTEQFASSVRGLSDFKYILLRIISELSTEDIYDLRHKAGHI